MVVDEGVVVLPPFEGFKASLFGCCMTVLLCQGEYPQAGAVSLFRVVFGAEHTIEEFDGVGPDALSAAHKIGLAPFADKTVGGGHVLLLSGISVRFGTVGVYRDSFVLVKNLDVPRVIQDLDLAANISVRDAVIVLGIAQLNMAVFLHRQFALLFPYKGFGRKWLQILALQVFEQLAAALLAALHR